MVNKANGKNQDKQDHFKVVSKKLVDKIDKNRKKEYKRILVILKFYGFEIWFITEK